MFPLTRNEAPVSSPDSLRPAQRYGPCEQERHMELKHSLCVFVHMHAAISWFETENAVKDYRIDRQVEMAIFAERHTYINTAIAGL